MAQAFATNDVGGTITAYVNHATVTSTAGSVEIAVSSIASVESLTVGVSGAGGVALAGSVSLDSITNTLDAHISGGANVTALGPITVSAGNQSSIESLAGGVAGAGGVAAGTSLATNDIGGTITAYVSGPATTVASHGRAIQVIAETGATVKSLTVGGAGQGGVALGGAVSLNNITNTVAAYVSAGAALNAARRNHRLGNYVPATLRHADPGIGRGRGGGGVSGHRRGTGHQRHLLHGHRLRGRRHGLLLGRRD